MTGIWPARIIPLERRGGGAYGTAWLSDEKVRAVVAVVAPDSRKNFLDQPVVLDDGSVRQLALVLLGDDGIAGGSLFLQVANERRYDRGHWLRLAIVRYGQVGGTERRRLRPDTAGDLLDKLVAQVRDVLGTDVKTGDDDD